MTMLYYGCKGQSGHHWFESENVGFMRNEHAELRGIDGAYAPRIGGTGWKVGDEAPEGVCQLVYTGKWTILAFWDRSVDHRPGSNSNFVWEGEHTFNEMMEEARRAFPWAFSRLTFDIRLIHSTL